MASWWWSSSGSLGDRSSRELCGLTGSCLPREHGGGGADALTTVLAFLALARSSHDAAQSIFPATHLLRGVKSINDFVREQLKERYLPWLASGDAIGAIALTEPDVGSDASNLQTSAVRDGDEYVLNGAKTMITTAPIADVLQLFATTDPSLGPKGTVTMIVDTDSPGVTLGAPIKHHGIRSWPIGEVFLENVRVPASCLLGEEGRGFKTILGILRWERLSFAVLVGMMEADVDDAIACAKQRQQFVKPIASSQLVQAMIAEMKIDLEASRWLFYHLAPARWTGGRMSRWMPPSRRPSSARRTNDVRTRPFRSSAAACASTTSVARSGIQR